MTDLTAADVALLASVLNLLPHQPNLMPRHDCVSGGVFWPDELPIDRPPSDWWAVRPLLHHRTYSLILGRSSEYADLWEVGLQSFPSWPGFRAERCEPDEELRRLVGQLVSR